MCVFFCIDSEVKRGRERGGEEEEEGGRESEIARVPTKTTNIVRQVEEGRWFEKQKPWLKNKLVFARL